MNKKLLLSTALISSLGLSGCTSLMSVGDTDYSCPGLPEGVVCQSVEENYKMTNGDRDVVKKRLSGYSSANNEKAMNDSEDDLLDLTPPSVPQIATNDKLTVVQDASSNGLEIINNPYVSKKTPQIEPPKVHSVWFAQRVGNDGRFYGERMVYFAKGNTRWQDSENYVPALSGTTLKKPKVFKPLQVIKSKRKKSNATAITPNMEIPSNVNIFNK